MPLDAKHFADEFAPRLVASLESRKDAIIASAGGLPRRAAIRLAWPTLIAEVPHLTESAIEMVSWRFGDLSVNDLLNALASIRSNSAGRP